MSFIVLQQYLLFYLTPWFFSSNKLSWDAHMSVEILENSQKILKYAPNIVYIILCNLLSLTLSWRRPLSYRNQSIDLLCKSMDWFLYDNGLCHERVNRSYCIIYYIQVLIVALFWMQYDKYCPRVFHVSHILQSTSLTFRQVEQNKSKIRETKKLLQ